MSTNDRLSKPIRLHQSACLALMLSLGISGCTLAPNYERPALPVPQTQGALLLTDSSNSLAVARDSQLSTDENELIKQLSPRGELRLLVQNALAFNHDFQIAALRVKEARASYGITNADGLPSVSAGLERNRQHFDKPVNDERYGQDLTVASIGASDFELDFFGRIRSLSDAARHDYLATTYGQRAARGALIAEVARLYLSERLAAAQQADTRLIDETEQTLLGMAQTQQREGAASLDDVMTQQAQVQRSHLQLQAATNEHARASQALLFVTGYRAALPAVPVEPAGLVEQVPDQTAAGLIDMRSERLLERFDVRQSEERLKAANANIGAARAAFFPSIRLSTSVGTASDSLQSLFNGGNGMWMFTPQLSLPLFDGGRNRANLKLAQVRKQIAVAQYEQAIQVAFREVADVLAKRQQVLVDLQSESVMSRLAQDKARRSSSALDAGGSDRTVQLASKIQLAQADIAWRRAHHALLLNRLDIYRVLLGVDAAPSQLTSDNEAAL
ncbi:efflux transporter outer membrane subunit [Pseudomonas corrugata]|uniref:efflux transporter outer membrane subunit n=1 Tax=Pseudomonas corrugata TaxID=47879 RepID=UPI00222E5023|nr:efflux transporter outer membrane subunit [Pseudomonas corrugata]UZD97737.1 efflux transporter outer membrane subunit [Pseudomonas corrugata]